MLVIHIHIYIQYTYFCPHNISWIRIRITIKTETNIGAKWVEAIVIWMTQLPQTDTTLICTKKIHYQKVNKKIIQSWKQIFSFDIFKSEWSNSNAIDIEQFKIEWTNVNIYKGRLKTPKKWNRKLKNKITLYVYSQ